MKEKLNKALDKLAAKIQLKRHYLEVITETSSFMGNYYVKATIKQNGIIMTVGYTRLTSGGELDSKAVEATLNAIANYDLTLLND